MILVSCRPRWLAVALFLAGGAFPFSAGSLSLGDDVVSFYQLQSKQYHSSRPLQPVEGWPGYETAVLATDPGFSRPPFLLVLRKVGGAVVTPFGSVEGPQTLLLDLEGDGRLDGRTSQNLIPGWLPMRIPGQRGSSRDFRTVADRIYRQYDRSEGPAPAQLELLVASLRTRAADTANLDRDLDAALLAYVNSGATQPALGAGTLKALARNLETRGGVPPLVALFLGEALQSLGQNGEAQSWFSRLTTEHPSSVIGAYKRALASPAALAAFRKSHPDFWASRE